MRTAPAGVTGERRLEVVLDEVTISVREWGNPDGPALVATPGTGLASELFLGVERLLAPRWHGFSIDRRGQGGSSTPGDGYEFVDFADDLREVVERLELQDVTGFGHSAGGTDMLLAAVADPSPWRRLIIFEPTIQDPRVPALNETVPPSWKRVIDGAARRRDRYPSVQAVLERWRESPAYRRARADLFHEYLEAALEPMPDGSVRLRCSPQVEARMNAPIIQVFERRYRPPDGSPDPFRPLLELSLPVTLVTSELSGPIYGEMVDRAASMLPNVTRRVALPGVGHLVPLEKPELVASLVEPPDK